MADFCYTCTYETFGAEQAPKNELTGLCGPGYVSAPVICEGCGTIQVDIEGRRVYSTLIAWAQHAKRFVLGLGVVTEAENPMTDKQLIEKIDILVYMAEEAHDLVETAAAFRDCFGNNRPKE